MNLFLVMLIISCGKGTPKDSSIKKNLEPKYRNIDGDFQARKEEENAVPNEKMDSYDTEEEINEIDYYSFITDSEIDIEELIQEIKNDKNFSALQKEKLLKKLIENNQISSEKTILLLKNLYTDKINTISLINYTISLVNNENINKYLEIIEFFLEKKEPKCSNRRDISKFCK